VTVSGSGVVIDADSRAQAAACPGCEQPSSRVHGRYRRTLLDLPVAGLTMTIRLRVRRFRCLNAACSRATFAEQIPDLTCRYARRTIPAGRMLADIALVLAGRAGCRLATRLGLPQGRDTLLRLVRRLPDPPAPEGGVQVLGVDDFALRRGHVYGTVLIDLDTHRPLDLLPERTAATVSTWLADHGQNVAVFCRDRAGAYAQAARDGVPDAVQVADRWHLWHNLAGHVEKAIKRLRHLWKHLPGNGTESPTTRPGTTAPTPDEATAVTSTIDGVRPVTGLDLRHHDRWHLVHDLLDAGVSLREITRRTGLSRGTVRTFARAERPDDLYRGQRQGRGRELDQHREFLREHWNAGTTNATQLLHLLRERGFQGQGSNLRAYLQPWRTGMPIPARRPPPLSVRELTRWLCTRPDDLTTDETTRLTAILDHCPPIAVLAGHVRSFAVILTHRTGDRDLNPWIAAVTNDGDQPELKSFARGLLADHDAVRAGLTLPYSSGPVEGHNTRIKMIKRKLYGRAKLDLLRKLVILGP
jgi:transposase